MTNPIKRFFLFSSGATRLILDMKGCEVEHSKYVGIGVTIFFTAVLAALSGGYAMFTVFRNGWLALAFGMLWGLIIFNLDRFIVSSIRKKSIPTSAPLTERIRAKAGEILKAVPRLILAVFISIVITRPLELKFFGAEIQGQLTHDLAEERADREKTIDVEFADIAKVEEETGKLKTRLLELENEVTRRVKVASSEADGWGGTQDPGDGPEYKKRLAETKEAQAELNSFRTQYAPVIQANEQQTTKRKAERAEKLKGVFKKIDDSGGLLKQLEALSALAQAHPSTSLASWFIIFLFISLETAPILVKLFSNRGPYDDYLDAIEHHVYATQRKTISDTNDEVNTLVALSKQRNADRISTELQMSQNTMASWTTLAPQEYHDAQVEIARIGVALWRANELNRLKQVTPPVAFAGQSSQPTTQSPASVTANPTPPNVSQATSPAGVTNSAGASSPGSPPPVSPSVSPSVSSPVAASNNGGGVQPNVGAATPTAPTQPAAAAGVPAAGVSAAGVPAATAGAQSSPSTPSQQGSTAPQTASASPPSSVPPVVQASQSLNNSTSGPGSSEQVP